MTTANPVAIKDTDKSQNILVVVERDMTVEETEKALTNVSAKIGFVISHITTLGSFKFSGNQHWHFKQDLKSKGCLDVTYWPDGPLFWTRVRSNEPYWVHKAGRDQARSLKRILVNR